MTSSPAPSPRIVFVMSPWQNAFFREIAEVLVDEVRRAGGQAVAITEAGDHVVGPDDVFVLMPPHEYVTLEGGAIVDDPVVAARTIGISAEQPHQVFFAANAEIGARLGAVVDFSPMAVAAYRERGVAAVHMPFGYTPLWDRFDPTHVADGPPRVLYLGNKRPRRLEVLAEHAGALARHRARVLVSDNSSPNMATGPTFVAGDDKRRLLASTRLLVNIHQGDEPYFEWLRFCEAAMAGTPYLTERSVHCEPWVEGEHFAVFDRPGLGDAIDALVDDEQSLDRLRRAAYEAVRSRPLSESVHVLLRVAETLRSSAPAPAALAARTRREPLVGPRPEVVPGTLAAQFAPAHEPGLVGRWRRWRRQRAGRSTTRTTALAPATTTRSTIQSTVTRSTALPGGEVLVAPEGTEFIDGGLDRLVDALRGSGTALATGVAVARERSGRVVLEGVWPWETWRLLDGQDLGKVMVVTAEAWEASAGFRADPRWSAAPHLAVALSVADRGARGTHLATPVCSYPSDER